MTLSELAHRIHKNNNDKGFYDDIDGFLAKTISGEISREFYDKYRELFINKQLSLIITEVAEAIEIHRKHGIDISLEPEIIDELTDIEFGEQFENKYKDKLQDELGDTMIRLLDLIGYLGINIDKWIEAKLRYNKTRPYLHGKKYWLKTIKI